VKEKLYYICKS